MTLTSSTLQLADEINFYFNEEAMGFGLPGYEWKFQVDKHEYW